MSINSNAKGKAGELEFANLLKEHGFDKARRSQQYAGVAGDADVIGLKGMHIEVKRVERLNLDKAMEQAIEDCNDSNMPMVAHRKNYKDWKVTMSFDDWIKLYKAWIERV